MTPETAFKKQIIKFLDTLNSCYHIPYFPSIYTPKGVPDILCCINGHFVAIEVKADNGKPSELQKYHVNEINNAGGIAVILYPKDFEEFKEICRRLI